MILAQYAEHELSAILEGTRVELAVADKEQDTVKKHDLRCLVDQLVAELEGRGCEEAT